MKKLIIVLFLIWFFCGCTTIQKGDFKYQSTIFDKKVDYVLVYIDPITGKVKLIEMKNYNSNADYVVEAIKALPK